MVNLSMRAFLEAGAVFILLTLSIYHLFIYAGRLDSREERANLHFSIISGVLAFYELLNSSAGFLLYPLSTSLLQPLAEGLVFFTLFVSLIGYLSYLTGYSLPVPVRNLFLAAALVLVLLTSVPLWSVNGYGLSSWYLGHLFLPVTVGVTALIAGAFVPYLVHIARKRLYLERPVILILAGLAAVIAYLLERKLRAASRTFDLPALWIPPAACLALALALSDRFNREYRALRDLKQTLERRVHERTEELKAAGEEIRRINDQRTALFVNLAHETRTPLTLIRYHLETYLAGRESDRDLQIIRDNIRKLQRDMVNFLDSEKLLKGTVLYRHDTALDLPGFLREKADVFGPLACRKGLEFRSAVRGEGAVFCDPFAMDRIVNNLLLNAIKFTDRGTVSLELSRTVGTWILTVSDTGRGMDENTMRTLFEPYAQLLGAKENIRGYGMGLFITRKIVEEIGGGIRVESRPGDGSVFRIELPAADAVPGAGASGADAAIRGVFEEGAPLDQIPGTARSVAENEGGTRTDGKTATVMLVEDNVELLGLMAKELEKRYTVITARGGNEALGLLRECPPPDLVISDIMMDDGDGESLYRAVSADSRWNSIPFVFCSARAGEETRLAAFANGVVEFIAKPFSMAELTARIESLLTFSRRQKELTLRGAIELLSSRLRPPSDPGPAKSDVFDSRCDEYALSDRQKEIVELIAEGFEYKEIADRLRISRRTVTRHIQNIYERLSVHNKVELLNRMYGPR